MAGTAMLLLTNLGLHSTYVGNIMPALILFAVFGAFVAGWMVWTHFSPGYS